MTAMRIQSAMLIRAIATIIVVGGGAVAISEIVSLFVERRLFVLESAGILSGRERTLLPLLRRAIIIVTSVVALFVILSEIGIDIGPLFAVDFDIDEVIVHEACGVFVLEGLALHHVAPVAGGVADAQQDRFIFLPGPLQRLLAPGMPVHRVVGVLQ